MDHDLPSSIALQRQAISEIQTDSSESIIDYGKDLAEFKLVLSDNLTLSGDPRAARKEAHEALEILQKIELGSSVDSGEALEKMAKADASLGQPLRADDEQTRANAIKFATIGSSEDTASGLILAAKYKLDLSDPNAALALFDQAQTMIQAHSQFAGPIALAFAIYRGRAFADLGQPQKSLDQFSLAHSLIEQANMPPQYVDSLRISEAESALKAPSNVQTAQAMLAKLSAIENDLRGKGKGGEEFLARTLTDLAEASMHAGDVKQAAVKATEARSIRVQRGDEEDSAPLAYCDVILAEVRRREGQDAAARTLMQNAAQHMETSLGAKHPRTLETRALAAGL
jgi:tetratricopeptide (TPR) repeat protein